MIKLRFRRPSHLPKFGLSALIFAALGLLLVWKLGSLPTFLTADEQVGKAGSQLAAMAANPLFAPWHVVQEAFLKVNDHSLFLDRLPSAIFGLLVLMAFYWTLRLWFGKPISYLVTILVGTTPLFLILARQGRPDILYFAPVLLMAAYVTLARAKESIRWPLIFFITSLALCLYIPGGFWIVLIGLVYRRTQLKALSASLTRKGKLLSAGGFLILIAPMVIGLIVHPHIYKQVLLLPDSYDGFQILKDWAWMISSLILKTKVNQSIVLGQLPVMDAVQIGLCVFGGYVMWSRLRTQFFWLFGLVAFFCLLAASAGGFTALSLTLPLISIVAGMGLRYLYIEWMHVFPRNPLPRYFAITLMAAVVLIHVMYGIRYSLIAWPTHIATTTVRMLK